MKDLLLWQTWQQFENNIPNPLIFFIYKAVPIVWTTIQERVEESA